MLDLHVDKYLQFINYSLKQNAKSVCATLDQFIHLRELYVERAEYHISIL